ncbi:DNA topoisomerase-1 [Chitinophaga costaii]|uniref:DNA topoisomerase n=1 Tax=Chitinophaga costaii TaxID=1335309 RepID=A0A1C4FQH9_9BACT|nr:DNA topoisomerase IB [Chitinophaga costaii]PUZ20462.1 DNA topoisomerase IB [Chitinophaga costaii]SCC58210.1 DNA topoisomerase-1 [Chitinophaga costaii]
MEAKSLTDNHDPVALAHTAKLRYVRGNQPGFTRVMRASGIRYLDTHGAVIKDENTLHRIGGLVLPPAWKQVWICPYANGHLQATGIDAAGRKQYRYHMRWAEVRSETKYHRLLHFGEILPQLRKQLKHALHHHQLDKEKVIAIAISVMEETLIRVGNNAYEKLYGSHGLTTLHNNHVTFQGSIAFFNFKGKKGVQHKIALKHSSLTRLLRRVKDIPGQDLFQYYCENGEHRCLDSGDINEFLRTHTGEDFSAKDFRTWAGTLHALNLLADLEPFHTASECKRNVLFIIDGVAAKLGNTRAVSKKYYIHPQLISSYEEGLLNPYLEFLRLQRNRSDKGAFHNDEKVLLQFLKDLVRNKKNRRKLISN